MIIRLLLILSGVLFLATIGAFFLLVPLLSLATVVCVLTGLILMFGLGVHVGARQDTLDQPQSLDRVRLDIGMRLPLFEPKPLGSTAYSTDSRISAASALTDIVVTTSRDTRTRQKKATK